jgi:glycosyltransferase involved in cell wall biosynthesis
MVNISIILATRNEKRYIGKTLKKALEASREAGKYGVSTEIIVVDNSTDDTFTEAKRYVKNVYRFIPRGVSKARNFGAGLAKGDILIFMDADTTLQKSSLVDALEKFKDSRVVSLVSRVLPSPPQRTLSTVLFYLFDGLYIRLCAYLSVLIRFYNRGDMTAIRKDVFDKIEGFNEKLHMLEITDILTKASSYGRVEVLGSPVFESSRRLKQWGLLKSYNVWWRNYISFYTLGRLYDSSYEACRGKDHSR